MKALKHLRTINQHKMLVMKNCFKVGLYRQGLMHDLSKYTPTEFLVGCRYYQGTRSPNEVERELFGFSKAWMHHKGRNKHHFEYWIDFNPSSKKYEPVEMPLNFVIEMFCDRVAASKIYQGEKYTESHPIEYFLKGKETRVIHKNTSDLIESLLLMVKEKGEEETFKYIKELKKKRN